MIHRRRHALNRPWMYQTGVAVVRRLPRSFNRAWVRLVADWNHWRLEAAREQVRDNLAPVVGAHPAVLRPTSQRLFRNYAEVMVDYATFFGGSRPVAPVFRAAQGYEHLTGALAAGRGAVLVTAHLGFWELGGLFFRQQGLPMAVLTVEDPDPGVHDERTRIRRRMGIETITVGSNPWSSLAAARALRQNVVVAMLVDRYQGPDAVEVEMFGRRTAFAPGPALYARMTGAAVVPAFVLADGRGGYEGRVCPPVAMRFTDDRAADTRRNGQAVARVIEGVIREFPDQWYNFGPIWR